MRLNVENMSRRTDTAQDHRNEKALAQFGKIEYVGDSGYSENSHEDASCYSGGFVGIEDKVVWIDIAWSKSHDGRT